MLLLDVGKQTARVRMQPALPGTAIRVLKLSLPTFENWIAFL